ncbi:MAG TPA: TerB family tellurite resistance protein [Desulfobacterales bacterium]
MGWIGKIIGGTLGFAIGGPLGAIAGAAFGHAFDRTSEDTDTPQISVRREADTAQFTFFVAVFSMLAKLVKTDGEISRGELDTIHRFMLYDLNLNPQSRMFATNIFNAALHSPNTFEEFASQFYGQFHSEPQLLEMMVDILLRVAVADGAMSASEEQMIRSAVRIFGFSESVYEKIRSRYVQTFDRYYAVLGVNPGDSNETVKSRYRKLVMEYHPDRVVARGLPEEFTKYAQDKFREIQEAYENIRKERGF